METIIHYKPGASFIDPQCFKYFTKWFDHLKYKNLSCEFGVPKELLFRSEFGSSPVCLSIYEIRNALKLLYKLNDNKNVYTYRGHPIVRVKIFGIVRKVSDNEKFFKFLIQDDSHTIHCLLWKNDFVKINHGELPLKWSENVLVSAFIKQMDSTRILDVFEISIFNIKCESLKEELKYMQLRDNHRNYLEKRQVKNSILSYWVIVKVANINGNETESVDLKTITSLDTIVSLLSERLIGFLRSDRKVLVDLSEIINSEVLDCIVEKKVVLPCSTSSNENVCFQNSQLVLDIALSRLLRECIILKMKPKVSQMPDEIWSMPKIYVPFNDIKLRREITMNIGSSKPPLTTEVLEMMFASFERSVLKCKMNSMHLKHVLDELMHDSEIFMIDNYWNLAS